MTELTNHIRVRVENEDPATEFSRVFPSFIWAVRDFTLQLREGERVLTEDEYLKDALLLKSGTAITMCHHMSLRVVAPC